MAASPPAVARWLEAWQARELQGASANDAGTDQLRLLLRDEPVSVETAAGIVELIARLDGDSAAIPLCGVVLDKGEAVLGRLAKGDTNGASAVAALWKLHPILWKSSLLEEECRLLAMVEPWEVYGSGHSQWMHFIRAETLYLQGRYAEAHEGFELVMRERKDAFEPSEGINRSLEWELGLTAYYARQYEKAIPYLSAVVAQQSDASTINEAWPLLIGAYARSGRIFEAESTMKEWIRQVHPGEERVASVLEMIEQQERQTRSNL